MRPLFTLMFVSCFAGPVLGSPLNGNYHCDIPPDSRQKKSGFRGEYYFTKEQQHAVVTFQDNRFIVTGTRPAPYYSPPLVPIQQFAMISRDDLDEIGADTLIYARTTGGLAYFTPSKQRFVFGLQKRIPANSGAFLLELINCRQIPPAHTP